MFVGSLILKDIGVGMQLASGGCLLMELPGSSGKSWFSERCAFENRALCQQSVCKNLFVVAFFIVAFCKHNYRVLV